MKISISSKIIEGPWGGGNLFVKNLSNFLENKNIKVVHNLFDSDIDIILLIDPRKDSITTSYSYLDVIHYLKYVNTNAVVVHRFNECDERKNTTGVNNFMIKANVCSDLNIFVSDWLKQIYLNQGLINTNNRVIMTGADKNVFNSEGYKLWDGSSKIKIVTHHWGNNPNKGFEIYKKLDDMIKTQPYKNLIEFKYIGNLPENFEFENTSYLEPLAGNMLANELSSNHIYLTASKNEPSGNHHIEAAQCGLPILYLDSGGIPEFCKGFGIGFNEYNFEEKLNEIIKNYFKIQKEMINYPYSSDKMCEEYLFEFEKIYKNKTHISKDRYNKLESHKTNKILFFIKYNIKKTISSTYYLKILFKQGKRIKLKIKSTFLK
ncbi:MAG: hypothetical protein CMQ83_01215 [Gammaproteobacteria bacterium]|nr:hypothetical protein [Gammaproteobacteria bacterium]|tara:strand:- start:28095 stop:29222 length:1128 start_codon:yes stop_codon:yes gene_type:complete